MAGSWSNSSVPAPGEFPHAGDPKIQRQTTMMVKPADERIRKEKGGGLHSQKS